MPESSQAYPAREKNDFSLRPKGSHEVLTGCFLLLGAKGDARIVWGFQCLFFAFLGNGQKLLEPHRIILLKPGPSACLHTSWACREPPVLECLPPHPPESPSL